MSGTRKSTRGKTAVNYKLMDKTGKKGKEESDILQIRTDTDEDNEFSDEEQLDYEESETEEEIEDGEITSDEQQSSEDDQEIKECMEEMNLEKLKRILKKRQEECCKLQSKVKKEKEKDLKKRKEMEKVMEMIKAADKKKACLQKSLESSRTGTRNTTPVSSPKTNKRKSSSNKDSRVVVKKRNGNKHKAEASEYSDTLNSLLKLKQGNGNEEYSELVMKAMEATDNMLNLKEQRKESKQETIKIRKTKSKGESKKGKNVIELLEKAGAIANKGNSKTESEDSDNCESEENNKKCEMTKEGANALLSKLLNAKAKTTKETMGEKLIDILLSDANLTENANEITKEEDRQTETVQKGKKLTSGKCTKPDESDIMRVIKFAHEKLDPRHARNKTFEKLNFHDYMRKQKPNKEKKRKTINKKKSQKMTTKK